MTKPIRIDNNNILIVDGSTDGSHPDSGNFITSTGNTAWFGGAAYYRVSGTDHPASSTVVLVDEGKAFYGGALYQRTEVPQRPAAKPSPVYSLGDRIVILPIKPSRSLTEKYVGKHGTVVENTFEDEKYDLYVDIDDGPDDADGVEELPLYNDEVTPEPIKVEDTYPFQPGDKVVYTIPEMLWGKPGNEIAVRPAGTTGTVLGQFYPHAVQVKWDKGSPGGTTSIEFVALAPAPTHAYPEGLYRGGYGDRVFVRHEDTPERYHVTYLDERHYETDVPFVNRYLNERVVATYSLIAEAPRS